MRPERVDEIRARVAQLGDPLWPGLTESDWADDVRFLLERYDWLRLALLNLRETVDFYVSDDVGMDELADAMDKSFAALYPKEASRDRQPESA